MTDTSQTREAELLRLNACLARGVQGGGEGIVGEQRYYLYCNHRQLAHNVRTMPKYKPFWWLAQKVSSMCTKQLPAGVQATLALKQQVHKFKISLARLQCTHTHTNFVYTSLNKALHIYIGCTAQVHQPGPTLCT